MEGKRQGSKYVVELPKLTQSLAVNHKSETPSIFPSTAAPFHTRTRGSTPFGGGIICTLSIFATSGVAMACSLLKDA